MLIEDGIELEFSHSDGLYINGDVLSDMNIYDDKSRPLSVSYEVYDNKLRILWNKNDTPVKLTLGYNNAPGHNLYNGSGYLASPFCLNLL